METVCQQMPKVVIEKVHAVGMRHYGIRQLNINVRMNVVPEPNNRYDSNAIKICDDTSPTTRAYLARYHASHIKTLFDKHLVKHRVMKLKAKMPIKKIGNVSTQICNIAFLTDTINIDEVKLVLGNMPHVTIKLD